MNDNKLIAEFMGYKVIDKPKVVNGENFFEYIDENGKYTYCNSLLRYNDQWDWLMPVVQKCYESGAEGDCIGDITMYLTDVDIKSTYKAVVEFIKRYSNK